MSRSRIVYTSLLKDEGFTDLNLRKVRKLIGMGLGEMLGVATFMALGCGNVVAHIAGSDTTHLSTVLSFALGIATSIIIFGHISGAIMNPALNISAVILGHMSIPKFVYYTLFQLLGAVLGVFIIKAVTPDLPEGFCVPQPNPEVGLTAALTVEILTSSVLALVFCSVLDSRNAPFASTIYLKFGLAIIAIAIPSAKYAGCSMNPARTFGPAFVGSFWNYHWVYWVGPCVGASLTAALYRLFFEEQLVPEVEKRNDSQPI